MTVPDNPSVFILYTTIGCHLCREAYIQVNSLAKDHIFIEERDIFDDELIREQYWDKIPVLVHPNGETLFFPFDENILRDWLS